MTNLNDMLHKGIDHRYAGRSNEAECILHQVLLDMSHVLGMTSEDMVKFALNLIDLYAASDRMNEAIAMIEKVMEYYLTTYGCEGPRNQHNASHAVESLKDWNNRAYILRFLALSKELVQSSSSKVKTQRANSQANKKGKAAEMSTPIGSRSDISETMYSVLEDLTPARVDYEPGVVPTHMAAKDRAAQGLLLAIISRCEKNSELAVQYIKAQAELLKLYDKLGEANEHGAEFEGALASLGKAWEAYSWEEDLIESFSMIEAGLQLITNALKCGYQFHARRMFRQASEKASTAFESDDERTVWVLFTIGLVYQTFMTWDDAEEWFEEAFAAALANPQWVRKAQGWDFCIELLGDSHARTSMH